MTYSVVLASYWIEENSRISRNIAIFLQTSYIFWISGILFWKMLMHRDTLNLPFFKVQVRNNKGF
jgi:hypothetical protein